jgi:hypothetical protein
MEEEISLDIKGWMSKVKKPQNLTVQDFVQCLSHLNELIEYAPVPNPINDPGVQTPKCTDAELAHIVRNACPAGWEKAQVHANLHYLSLAAQTILSRTKMPLIETKFKKPKRHCWRYPSIATIRFICSAFIH